MHAFVRKQPNDRGGSTLGTLAFLAIVGLCVWPFWGDIKSHLPFIGPERSVDAYCKTFVSEGNRLNAQVAQQQKAAGDNPLASAGLVFGSLGDMATVFNKLDQVAPDEIEPDIHSEAQALDEMRQRFGDNPDPLSLAMSSFVVGLQQQGVEQRIDAYTKANCAPPQ